MSGPPVGVRYLVALENKRVRGRIDDALVSRTAEDAAWHPGQLQRLGDVSQCHAWRYLSRTGESSESYWNPDLDRQPFVKQCDFHLAIWPDDVLAREIYTGDMNNAIHEVERL